MWETKIVAINMRLRAGSVFGLLMTIPIGFVIPDDCEWMLVVFDISIREDFCFHTSGMESCDASVPQDVRIGP